MALTVPTNASLQAQAWLCFFSPMGEPTHLSLSCSFRSCRTLSKGHCQKWHNEAESLTTSYAVIGHERVKSLPTKGHCWKWHHETESLM